MSLKYFHRLVGVSRCPLAYDVGDEGIGLKDEDAARLFEPFYTTKFTGRGLGMAVVYGIVRSHRGAIRIASNSGNGTSIRVLFPQIETRIAHENTLPDTISERGDASLGKVLVVDDEEYVRDLVRDMLEFIGFEVLEAENGSEGLALFSGQQVLNVYVIDVTMPGMGGIELARKIREQNASVPVLLVSGCSQQDVRDGKFGAENIKFLQKPFTIDQIKLAIDSAKQMTVH
jgi:two-component system cell cycle sensor histidine kinase/response regulator CckA